MPTPLTEHLHDWRPHDLLIDHEHRLVKNIALTGTTSKNGYTYSEQALRDALPHYANKPVFLDHAPNSTRPHDRSTRDLVGSIVNPRYERQRIRGDIQVLDTEAGRTFLALAAAGSPAVGMSHVVLAERTPDGTTVTQIHDVISVDAVTFPATTQTLHEHAKGDWLRRTADPRFLPDSHAAGACPPPDAEPVPGSACGLALSNPAADSPPDLSTLQSENHTLRTQLQHLQHELDHLRLLHTTSQLEHEITTLLAESRLPPHAITDHFRTQLRQAPDRATRQHLIEDRRHLITILTRHSPQSHERPLSSLPSSIDTTLIQTLKRHP